MNTYGKKLIGKGAFSKVWDNGDGTVIIRSKDYAKEALALWISGDRFPQIERLDYAEISTYKMPKYEKTKGIKKNVSAHEWDLYKWLRDNCQCLIGPYDSIHKGYSKLYEAFESMPAQFAEEKEQLIDALNELSNYGSDIAFEISPRNIFIVDGRIIFADCFFFMSQLQEIRSNQRAA